MAHDVFICYAAEDKAVADAVCATLEGRRIRSWIAPRDVLPGMDYAQALVEAISESRVMVLVFSAHSNDSPHVRREVERAVSRGIAILPFRIEDVAPSPSLEFFISGAHWLDALTPPLERHLDHLAGTVELLLSRAGRPAQLEGEPEAPVAAPRVEAAMDKGPRQPAPPRRALEAAKRWIGRPMVWLPLSGGAIVAVTVIALLVLVYGGGNDNGGAAPVINHAEEFGITTSPDDCVQPGGRLEVTWWAPDQEGDDLIRLAPRPDDYGGDYDSCWYEAYVQTVGGREICRAPATEDSYHFELVRNGEPLARSDPISVDGGCESAAEKTSQPGYSLTASPDCVQPLGKVKYIWEVPQADPERECYLAFFEQTGRNSSAKSKCDWLDTSNRVSDVDYCSAPDAVGTYELRLISWDSSMAVSELIEVAENCQQ